MIYLVISQAIWIAMLLWTLRAQDERLKNVIDLFMIQQSKYTDRVLAMTDQDALHVAAGYDNLKDPNQLSMDEPKTSVKYITEDIEYEIERNGNGAS